MILSLSYALRWVQVLCFPSRPKIWIGCFGRPAKSCETRAGNPGAVLVTGLIQARQDRKRGLLDAPIRTYVRHDLVDIATARGQAALSTALADWSAGPAQASWRSTADREFYSAHRPRRGEALGRDRCKTQRH